MHACEKEKWKLPSLFYKNSTIRKLSSCSEALVHFLQVQSSFTFGAARANLLKWNPFH